MIYVYNKNEKTCDNENINIEGKIAHPTTVSAIQKLIPNKAKIVYVHINKNITAGMYFKHKRLFYVRCSFD